jgi:threonine aldolase
LCGDEKFIRKAQRIRKQLGGGMRQAGIIAAAGIVALEKVLPRLPEDHRRAHLLADGLRHVEGIHLEPNTPQTNMVYIVLDEYVSEDAYAITKRLMEKGVKVGPVGKRRFRLVLHYWITDPDVKKTVMTFKETLMDIL